MWSPFLSTGKQTEESAVFPNPLSNDFFSYAWNLSLENLLQYQEMLQQFTRQWLQLAGLPTREDLSRTNRQYYELANRLDEIESRLAAALADKTYRNEYLQAEVERLSAEVARLRSKQEP